MGGRRRLLSTREQQESHEAIAEATQDSRALSNFLRASITRRTYANHEPIVL